MDMIYSIDFKDSVKKDIDKLANSGQLKLVKKVKQFIEELQTHPTTGTGQVEPLKGFGERQLYSRRIDKKHRLIYEVLEDQKRVEILSAYGHYED
ncbi:Txe/YoeB family addiction module toxin [Capnocytophaga catalasegens]|uniref:Putative mRNA interferase YoeB n=1 Tax=Capnocytophaga catalasegens TaxID=1004260 RepID=A0AAV5AY11_9FLAO|nr:Txe/YoeB family addiction module toxin [Capnocytophaga catalasegens]GIZ15550.1 hypothetical protein RCZ03_15500 [Capnocytophaga catalasegens]GJM49893.1 hypothetical protein RCZ15_08680 [Capnocytophaga catalasegens]GJM54065.1 hypothetical protein RCZ16_23810 [Capnocytophaga catalasegens]